MMFTRFLPYSREKFLILLITLVFTVSAIYLYLNNLQQKLSVQSSGERCVSELTSLRYQLNGKDFHLSVSFVICYFTIQMFIYSLNEFINTQMFLFVEVTQYKNRIDKLLTDTQAAQERDKKKIKDVMDSCVAMKQQATLCQNQFQDLQSECKKVRDDYNQLKKQPNV
ncbi:unnamed protein product [Diatraea saccharalis]|uniref:Uncharacterized protein n=1 Tax=Diatraea saccharalis TaxID=40085 RepID=A0A9N9MYZ5_9NEOP|nr:unnamed protein product [Diatraea saccharalis]